MTKMIPYLVAGCLLLSGCQQVPSIEASSAEQTSAPSVSESVVAESAPSAPQSFLESHSEQDLERLFIMVSTVALPNMPNSPDPFPYYGFENTSQLSTMGLFNFFQNFHDGYEAEAYWEESNQRFHIPLAFVEKTLDKYFTGYTFSPEELSDENGYQLDKQIFVMRGLVGHDARKTGVRIEKAERNADGKIRIEAKSLDLDIPGKETGSTEILVLQPTEEGCQFVSYQVISAEKQEQAANPNG